MLAKTTLEVTDLFGKYRLSEALMAVYKLFWDEFSSWYLEMVKPAYGQPIDRTTYEQTLKFFEALLMQLHPFMPFITEELWQHIYDRQPGESIMTQQLRPDINRQFRKSERSHRRHPYHPSAKEHRTERNPGFGSGWSKSGIRIQFYPGKDGKSVRYPYGRSKSRRRSGLHGRYYRICCAIGQPHQLKKLEADLKYQEGFLQSVLKKLGNEKFVSKAPANVIEMERKKQADAETKIAALKESIAALKK